MLKKMGWEDGSSLGQREGTGLKEPVRYLYTLSWMLFRLGLCNCD